MAKVILKSLIPIVSEVAPIPAAVVLFTSGAIGICHAHRAHRLARQNAHGDEARLMLKDIHDHIDRLEPEQAQAIVNVLANEYHASLKNRF